MMDSNTRPTEIQKYFNWKVVLAFFSTLTIIGLVLLITMRSYFSTIVQSDIFDKYYNLFVGILFLNMCLSTYTITLYYYRISKPGMKGPPGNYGKLGDPGDSETCDLYSPKSRKFSLQKEVKAEKYIVNDKVIRNATLDLDRRRIDPKWFNIKTVQEGGYHASKNFESPKTHILGNKFSKCVNKGICSIRNNNYVSENNRRSSSGKKFGVGVMEGVYNKNKDEIKYLYSTKPFNGAIFNYDLNNIKTIGKINSLQFTYDKNQPMRKNKIKIGMVDERLGNKNNTGKGGEFTCPPHSSIYKIETLHDNDTREGTGKIVGMKFHCKDIKTGEHIKILNADNNFVDSIHFGVEPTPQNKNYKYSKVECGNYQRCKDGKCLGRPGFLSNYTSIEDDDGVIALRFNKCSYLEPNPIKSTK